MCINSSGIRWPLAQLVSTSKQSSCRRYLAPKNCRISNAPCTSLSWGAFSNSQGPLANKAAASNGSTLFLAPCTGRLPIRGLPPSTRKSSIPVPLSALVAFPAYAKREMRVKGVIFPVPADGFPGSTVGPNPALPVWRRCWKVFGFLPGGLPNPGPYEGNPPGRIWLPLQFWPPRD